MGLLSSTSAALGSDVSCVRRRRGLSKSRALDVVNCACSNSELNLLSPVNASTPLRRECLFFPARRSLSEAQEMARVWRFVGL
eukprot:6208520-Pleurochrysis_carterae.AAC.4